MEAGSVLGEDKGFAVRPRRQVGAWRDNLRLGSGRLGSRYPVVADRAIIGRMHEQSERGWRVDQHVATMPSKSRENKGDRRCHLVSSPLQTYLPPEGGSSCHSRVRRLI